MFMQIPHLNSYAIEEKISLRSRYGYPEVLLIYSILIKLERLISTYSISS